MSAFNSHQTKAMVFVKQVKETGKPLNIICPTGGNLSLIMNERVYGELHTSIRIRDKKFWNRGRAGFTYTDFPQNAPYTDGIWIFPEVSQAIEKRNEMLANGWNSKFCSWEELEGNT